MCTGIATGMMNVGRRKIQKLSIAVFGRFCGFCFDLGEIIFCLVESCPFVRVVFFI